MFRHSRAIADRSPASRKGTNRVVGVIPVGGRSHRLLPLYMLEEYPGPAEYVYGVVLHLVYLWAGDLTCHALE